MLFIRQACLKKNAIYCININFTLFINCLGHAYDHHLVLTIIIDGVLKFSYSRRQKTLFSGGETDGGTSSRSNEGTIYGGIKSARRESARRRNMLSDQSDIIEDLYL